MKKLVTYILVFVLGFGACALILRGLYGFPTALDNAVMTAPEGQRKAPAVARAGRNPVAEAAAVMGRAVVNIDTVGRPMNGPFPGLDLRDFLGLPDSAQPIIPKDQGSGVIIRPEGYILTNQHVVANAQTVTVRLNLDGNKVRSIRAKIVGVDPNTDLAVVKIPPRPGGYPYAKFGDSDTLQVGDWVIAIGNALGLGTTVTAGVVSAKERALEVEGTTLEHAIQTDAAINRGNSGGALSDLNGRLVGINTAIASTSPGGGSIGIGFAIPSNTARRIADELISKGKIVRPWIGIGYRPLTDEIRDGLKRQGAKNIPGSGVLILEVMAGSPADKVGLQPLDIILNVDGKKATTTKVVQQALQGKKPGDPMTLEVWHARTGRISRVVMTLGEMPQQLPR